MNGESSELLIKDSPLRGGNFQPREVRDLPLPGLNPLSLARTLPGATDAAGSSINSGPGSTGAAFSIDGQRAAPQLTLARNAIDPTFRTPYTERWSFGFQRQLLQALLMDVSYVGSESHKLPTNADWNARQFTNVRLYPEFGHTLVLTSQGNSSYHALQTSLDRRFSRGFQIDASYTWSKDIDSTSDASSGMDVQAPAGNDLTSVPVLQGGLKLDRGLSDYDPTHRLIIGYLWVIPGPRSGWMRYALGGWSIGGITTFQSGTPFTVGNGFDRNNDGFSEDRPDIGNPNAPLNTRAIIFPTCASGYQNPDTGSCVESGRRALGGRNRPP